MSKIMGNIIEHPTILDRQEFPFKDGSILSLVSERPITVRDAIYMCEEVKLQLMQMLRELKDNKKS